MKYLNKYLIIVVLFIVSHSLFANTVKYTIYRTYNLKDAASFKSAHGIHVLSSAQWQKVSVEVWTTDNVNYNQLFCSHSTPLLLYKSFVTKNNLSPEHNGVDALIHTLGFAALMRCYTTRRSDSFNFYKNEAFTAGYWLNNPGEKPFKKYMTPISVKIVLTLEGDLKLSDIKSVKTPGNDLLYPNDFISRGYNREHDCNSTNFGVCSELNKVRSIPNKNSTDVIIQAHRGIWGKPNTNQENTIGAMVAAKNKGYKILESDIMPIAVSNYTNPSNASTFGVPGDLACFHDFVLNRYTSASSGFIFDNTRSFLSGLSLKKPRSETIGTEKIMFFDQLIYFAANNNLIVCVDMKNLESKGQGGSCTQLCEWQTQARKNISLYHNLKFAINSTPEDYLKNIAIKTYAKYDDLKAALTTGLNAVSVAKFDKILWAPLIAGNPQWDDGNGNYDVSKIQKFLDDWFAHNESVLYYETNFFNDFDYKTSVMLNKRFCFLDKYGVKRCSNVMEYIYNMTGRRAGIFSEEPVGSKGTVNRWGKWSIKNPVSDRRGDHLWLLKQPFFKHAVITTDRPDQWDKLND